jgi:NADPH:quinone reductase-like Zn-dependent oxidoreductase
MAESRIIRSLGVEGPDRPFFFEYEEGPLPDGQFRVDTLYTGLSAGTELTFVKGTNPYLHARWDDDLGIFQEGEQSASYPIHVLGYMEVGRVVESRTPAAAPGAIVAMTYGHKTGHTADPLRELCVPVPPDLDPLLGIYVAQMGPICANGLLHAAHDLLGPHVRELGDGVRDRVVLVTGGGVIGLLTGLFARHLGAAAVAVVDPTPERLAAARGLGLEAIDEREPAPWRACKERWGRGPGDRGVDVVFQCRGQAASLQTALRSLRPQGTVIDLAFYQGGAPGLRLGEEFHHNGLGIRCAQIGRVPRGLGHLWDRARLARATLELLQAHGAAIREHLITDIVPYDDAPAFVAELAARRRHAIQAVFAVAT